MSCIQLIQLLKKSVCCLVALHELPQAGHPLKAEHLKATAYPGLPVGPVFCFFLVSVEGWIFIAQVQRQQPQENVMSI